MHNFIDIVGYYAVVVAHGAPSYIFTSRGRPPCRARGVPPHELKYCMKEPMHRSVT